MNTVKSEVEYYTTCTKLLIQHECPDKLSLLKRNKLYDNKYD